MTARRYKPMTAKAAWIASLVERRRERGAYSEAELDEYQDELFARYASVDADDPRFTKDAR